MYEVTAKIWRGPRPQTYLDLQLKGFTRVIDLQSGLENWLTDSELEFEEPRDFGIERLTIRCSSVMPPTRREVNLFLGLLEMSPRKTYVHCHSGVDRTGFMIAVYRMRKMGWNYKKAYDEWVMLGRHWWFDWWRGEMREWEV